MLNRWIGSGRLTKDPELKKTYNGLDIATFKIAVDRDGKPVENPVIAGRAYYGEVLNADLRRPADYPLETGNAHRYADSLAVRALMRRETLLTPVNAGKVPSAKTPPSATPPAKAAPAKAKTRRKTKEELQAYTRQLILNHGKLGLMLGGDCTLDSHIDHERIRWVVEAARSL